MQKLIELQAELKAPKNQRNNFGNYNYRSCEDILEALKPLLLKYNLLLTLDDEIVDVGGRIYVKATAEVSDEESDKESGSIVRVTAYARESETKKGMDDAQITGGASSYARKYALNGLFLIDDTKDSDTDEHKKQTVQVGKTIQKSPPVQRNTTPPPQTATPAKTIADAINVTNVKLIEMNWAKYVKLSGGTATDETFKALLHSKYKQVDPKNLTNTQAKEFINNLIAKNKQLEATEEEKKHEVTPEQADELAKEFNETE